MALRRLWVVWVFQQIRGERGPLKAGSRDLHQRRSRPRESSSTVVTMAKRLSALGRLWLTLLGTRSSVRSLYLKPCRERPVGAACSTSGGVAGLVANLLRVRIPNDPHRGFRQRHRYLRRCAYKPRPSGLRERATAFAPLSRDGGAPSMRFRIHCTPSAALGTHRSNLDLPA